MSLGLDDFATEMVTKHTSIQKDKELMEWLKKIGTRENCLHFFKYIYSGFGWKW